ncbi:MAG: hypothetical protein V3U76_02390 [Granulosicoccus sp.]
MIDVRQWLHRLCLLAAVILLQACASSGVLQTARDQFRQGNTDAALQTLSSADVAKRNRLLLYLDRGLIAQAAGNYSDSINALSQAADLVEKLDFVSFSEQTTSLIANDWTTSYRGEYSERLWIHTFQMMNYLLINKPEGAAVEARRALKVFENHGTSLKADNVTRMLMAMSFEAAGQYDSAAVEYRKLFKDAADVPGIAAAALRNAKALGRADDAARYAAAVSSDHTGNASNDSELIVLLANGFIEAKLPGNLFIAADMRVSFPYYPSTWQTVPTIDATVDGQTTSTTTTPLPLLNISQTALNARGKKIAAKQALRIAAKYNIGESVGDEYGEVTGSLVRTLLFLLEQADTRSWETLPAQLSLVRIPMTAGTHTVVLNIRDSTGIHSTQIEDIRTFSGRRSFRLLRTGIDTIRNDSSLTH